MSGARQWIFLIVAALGISMQGEAQTKAPRAAFTPEPVAEASWMRRVGQQQQQLVNQASQVCFIGDSLTEFWTSTGRAVWDAEFAPLKTVNLGLTADRTEHILHRIRTFDFRRANPKVVVLLMGTNNLGMEPPDTAADVAKAIMTGVIMLRAKLPQASILVLNIPPSGVQPGSPLRQSILATNTLLERAVWPERVRLLPIHDAMVDQAGNWREGYTLDGTHFSERGYSKLGDLVAPVVKQMLEGKG